MSGFQFTKQKRLPAGWQSLPLLVTGEGASAQGVLQFLHALETRVSAAATYSTGIVVCCCRYQATAGDTAVIMKAASPLALTPLLLVASLASVADGSLGINTAGAGQPAISSVSGIKYDTCQRGNHTVRDGCMGALAQRKAYE